MEYALFDRPAVPLWESAGFTRPGAQGDETALSDEALYGWPARCLARAGGWTQVSTHYGYTGWVQNEGLRFVTEARLRQTLAARRWMVTAAWADVLTLPRVQGVRLLCLPRGSLLALAADPRPGESWAAVTLLDGQPGFVRREALSPCPFSVAGVYSETLPFDPREIDEKSFRSAVCQKAMLYMGSQYRWGGKTPAGIDCSGLAQMSYMLCGVNIYRDAKIKPGWPVQAIDPAQKQPGDLLFFPGHVALYLGGGRYIHSTARAGSAGVDINSLEPTAPDYRDDLRQSLLAVGSLF